MARSYTTVFFDLDGTLLPMDTDVFMKRYFKALGAEDSAEPNLSRNDKE